MIRPALTEIGIFLIPFGVYALYLLAMRAGVLSPVAWPAQTVARLVIGALLLVIASLVVLRQFNANAPNLTYTPAHIENGRLVPGVEK